MIILRIGILGGSFDPIHNVHLLMGDMAAEEFKLDKVLFTPAARNPFKTKLRTSDYHREHMLYLAVKDNPKFEVCEVDIDRNINPTRSADTVKDIRSLYPEAELFFIMGEDSFLQFTTWDRYEQILKETSLIVLNRYSQSVNPDIYGDKLISEKTKVMIIENGLFAISSTAIFERLRTGKTVRYLMPEAVWEYIVTEKLYQ